MLALDKNGIVWGWGCNDYNQLGRRLIGRSSDSYTPRQMRICRSKIVYIASGECHSFAVDQRGHVWAWGRNTNFECARETEDGRPAYPTKIPNFSGSNVTLLAGGANHSASVTTDDRCFAWGKMDSGQLGMDFTAEQLQDTSLLLRNIRDKPQVCTRPVLVPNVGHVTHVACGTDHTLFVNADGQAYATGYGFDGQLGLKSTDDVSVAQQLTGNAIKERKIFWAGAGGRFSIITGAAK